jgi:hypothetical protein
MASDMKRKEKLLGLIATAEISVFECGDDAQMADVVASVIKDLAAIRDKIMLESARGTADGKRFKKTQRNNSSGVKGVTFNKSAGKWQAKIGAGAGKAKHLGNFQTMEDAVLARASAEAEMWGKRN